MKPPVFAHIVETPAYRNLGDIASCPQQYFPEYRDCPVVSLDAVAALPAGQPVIIGGGGILAFPEFIAQTAQHRPTIVFGAGLNNVFGFDEHEVVQALLGCLLVGVRDRRFAERHGFHYAPCASAMHSLFDGPARDRQGVLIYQHAWESQIPDLGFPHERLNNMDRSLTTYNAIYAVCTHQTIITNSYHGAYWAQCAGKRAILWRPSGLRFFSGLPYVPCIVHTEEELKAAFDFSPTTAKMVGMTCRAYSQEFRDKVNHLLKTL